MNIRKKSILASGLGLLAAAIWVPTLSGLIAPSSLPPRESAAEAPQAEAGFASDGFGASASSFPTELEGFDDLEAPVQELGAGRLDDDLAALLAALALPDSSAAESDAPAFAALDLRAAARQELSDFAQANAVSGVIHGASPSGPDASVALLGHRVVRVGELLPGGRVRVESIAPNGLEISLEGETLWLSLPAFRAREADDDRPPPAAAEPSEAATPVRTEAIPAASGAQS